MGKGRIEEAIANFQYGGELLSACPYGSGHINDTYLLTFKVAEMGKMFVILQRMNNTIFKEPVKLMENIVGVTSYLRDRIIENGGDPERETLNVIPAKDGKKYFVEKALEKGVTVYDFQSIDFTLELDNYKDTTHYKPEINDYMTRCFATGEHVVTIENYAEYESKLIKMRNDFKQEYKELFE